MIYKYTGRSINSKSRVVSTPYFYCYIRRKQSEVFMMKAPGDNIIVIGAGAVGSSIITLIKHMFPSSVIGKEIRVMINI